MKKRIILASTVALSLAPTLATQAEEIVWSPRSVEQIQNDVAKSENKTSYTIKYGDTLSTIAEALGVDLNVLANLNKITNIDLIFPETVLTTTVNDNEEVTEVEVYTPQEVGSDVASATADLTTNQVTVDEQTVQVEDLTQPVEETEVVTETTEITEATTEATTEAVAETTVSSEAITEAVTEAPATEETTTTTAEPTTESTTEASTEDLYWKKQRLQRLQLLKQQPKPLLKLQPKHSQHQKLTKLNQVKAQQLMQHQRLLIMQRLQLQNLKMQVFNHKQLHLKKK